MDDNIEKQLILFDQLLKKMDSQYHQFAKHSGLSDTAFWIICAIQDEEEVYIQKDLCNMWSYSKQTINSALKTLEQKGIIYLELLEGKRKDKRVLLTEKGKVLAEEVVSPLLKTEKEAFSKLSSKERTNLLKTIDKYINILHNEIKELYK